MDSISNKKTGKRRPFRIVMPIYRYFPVIMGGAERQAERLSQTLHLRGHSITLVTGWWDRNNPQCEIVKGIEIFRNSTLWNLYSGWKPFKVLKHYWYELSLAWYLIRRRNHYDLIHVHQALHSAVVSVFIGKLIGKKVLIKVGCGGAHGDMKRMKDRDASPVGNQFWNIIRKCDRIVAISKEIKEELVSDGFSPDQVATIPNGIAADLIPAKKEYRCSSPVRLAFVGRLVPQKGFDVLVEALDRCSHEIQCHAFGAGEEEKIMIDRIAKKGLQSAVVLEGVAHDLTMRLRDMDIFVLPSRSEGMSNALLEAMAAGLPCIATNIGGNRDLIAPEKDYRISIPEKRYEICNNGILVNSNDPEGLRAAVEFLAASPKERKKLGNNARQWVQEHADLSEVADEYEKLYENMFSHDFAAD